MRNRSHPLRAVVLCLAASALAGPAESADDRTLVEMEPAHAAREALAPIVAGPPKSVAIEIETPAEGTIFSDAPVAYLAGHVGALGRTGRVDAVVVIDTSESTTRYARRRDPVKARMRGRHDPWARPPSILAQELRSAELLLADLDPRDVRIAIVTFAGADEGQAPDTTKSARTEVALTRRFEALDAGLQRVAARGAAGRTDMAAALDRAVAELTGRGESRPDRATEKAIVFFTDGTPTLPFPDDARANERAVFEAAERAAAAGIRVFSFAIGPEALRRPTAAVEMARRTGGVYTPVERPDQLADAVTATVAFERVGGELHVENASLRVNASDLQVREDGAFGGVVPLRAGKNEIVVRAVAGRRKAQVTRSVHYAPGSAVVWHAPEREILAVPTPGSGRELKLATGQRRVLDLHLGSVQRKEIEIGLSAPASRAGGR